MAAMNDQRLVIEPVSYCPAGAAAFHDDKIAKSR
jgi:hypothetical protein